MIEVLDKIASILSSLTIIIGSLVVAYSFRYKFDSEVRNLYIKNCEKICEALDKVATTGEVSNEAYNQITLAFLDSQIYLHNDIIEFTEDIRKKVINLQCKQMQLENLDVGAERNQKCDEEAKLKVDLDNKRKEARKIYRKYIVNEPFAKFSKK